MGPHQSVTRRSFVHQRADRRSSKTVKRGKTKRADFILYHKPNLPLAIIEAKDNKHSVSDGIQQALTYSEILHIPFSFSSNGDAFSFHDRTGQSDPR